MYIYLYIYIYNITYTNIYIRSVLHTILDFRMLLYSLILYTASRVKSLETSDLDFSRKSITCLTKPSRQVIVTYQYTVVS